MSRFRIVALGVLAAAFAVSLSSGAGPERAFGGAGTIVVDTNLNNDINDGLCSLREAIIAANTNVAYNGCDAGAGGTDNISFALGNQVPTINIATELPVITAPVIIDGGAGKIELRGPRQAGDLPVSGDDGITITGPDVHIENLVINNFRDVGILSTGDRTLLRGNYIGTDVTGTIAMPNLGFGVQLHGSASLIGGSRGASTECVLACNLLSGNTKAGILLDINSSATEVFGNFIGTDITGGNALVQASPPNGVEVKGDFHHIGGGVPKSVPGNACTASCNVITGSTAVHVFAGADTTSIGNNFLGIDVTGGVALQVQGIGVRNAGHHTFVGGDPNVAGNLISGWGTGIFAEADLLFVERNLIGTNFDGTQAVGNTQGILIDGGESTIIQNENLISGNGRGIIANSGDGVQIRGNFIGTGVDGSAPTAIAGGGFELGNSEGIVFQNTANLNSVGDINSLNEIAYNQNAGILVDGPAALRIIIGPNSIHDNGGLGIDNVNGGNTELSPPIITLANETVASGTACASCTIQIFSDNEDEGRIYQGMTTADGTGAWAFAAPVGFPLVGPNVTATAMDALLNTSEFSQPFVIFEPTPTPSPTLEPTPTPTPTPTGQQVAWGDNNCSNEPPNPVDSLFVLRHDAGLSTNTGGQCPNMGEQVDLFVASQLLWGDVDCSGVANPVDSLKLLRFDAGLAVSQDAGCPDIGETITIQEG